MPSDWIQAVVGVAAAVSAVAGVFNAKKGKDTDKKLETLDRNGGSSLRDDVDKVLARLTVQDKALSGQDGVLSDLKESVTEVKDGMSKFESRIQQDELKIARYIVHEANGTLAESKLLAEEKYKLEKMAKDKPV